MAVHGFKAQGVGIGDAPKVSANLHKDLNNHDVSKAKDEILRITF